MDKRAWISVDDDLPQDNGRVIILSLNEINDLNYPYNYEDACEMGFYENGKWHSDTRFLAVASSWQALDGVTHWMPLPEPP
ncbi:MAG: DUF551 domain-containing protein [Halobacteriota archaeon]|nr:DUF551 domain-containing protein [Halobacteriota archaeon]